MNCDIVLGSQFGDEAKGSFVNHLCKKSIKENYKPLVIRFNGGHQAGHTVFENGNRHTFSSFGSGTFQNVPTFWSRFCTVYPTAVFNEYKALEKLGITPSIFFDSLCPITTPLDILANILEERRNGHGTVGVGFGTTLKRQEAYYKLYLQDLFNKTVLKAKIKNIFNYYNNLYSEFATNEDMYNLNLSLENWYKCIDFLINSGIFSKSKIGLPFYNTYDHLIFEGAQGILLDMDFGFFPNVTRSNTTSKNVFTIIDELRFNWIDKTINYITRPYQTRHGAGFMSNTNFEKPKLINIENEINLDYGEQGVFKRSILDLDLISYAVECDNNFSKTYSKNIVISCLDQVDQEDIKYTINGALHSSNITELKTQLTKITGINNIILGESEGIFK